jgi:arabinogalactan endo-1,4-beta-galactosidase
LFFNVDAIHSYTNAGAVWQSAGVFVDGAPLTMSRVAENNLQSFINYPPRNPDDFADYATNLAQRYPQIKEWEVWNEPNTSFFWRVAVDVEAYVRILKKTYVAVKSANPDATVILGGLSPGDTLGRADAIGAADFLAAVYKSGGGAFFDAVAYHAYGDGAIEKWLPDALMNLRRVMDSNGDVTKHIWITEIGYYTQGPGTVSEAYQADYLRRARTLLEHVSSVERIYWFKLKDANQSSDPKRNYGLFRTDGTPKPAVKVFTPPLD